MKHEYDKEVSDGISVINSVLQKLNKPPIFENPDIKIEWADTFVQFSIEFDKSKRKTEYPELEADPSGLEALFTIGGGGDIEICLNIFPEAFYWSYEEIVNEKAKIENELLMLLTSVINVEYHGTKYWGHRTIRFYNSSGECLDTFQTCLLEFHKLICIKTKKNYKTETYMPFYVNAL